MPALARRGGSPLSAGREEAEEGAGRAGAERSERGGGRAGFQRSESSLGEGRRAAGELGGRESPAGAAPPPPAARRAFGTAGPQGPAAFREEAAQAAAGARALGLPHLPAPGGTRAGPDGPGGRREDLAARAAAQQPGSTSDPARGAGSMATGLGEAVYGLSEDEVSCAPFPTGLPGRFLSGGGREWGVGRPLGCASPAPAGGPQRRERPGAGSRWGARFFRPEPAAPPPRPCALFVNKAARRPASLGFTRRSPPLGGRMARALLSPRVPFLQAASLGAVGQLSAFRPCSPGVHDVCHVWVAGWRPAPCGGARGRGKTWIVSPWNFLMMVSASVLMRVCLLRWERVKRSELCVSDPLSCRV